MLSDLVGRAAESRAKEMEAAIVRFRECGVEIERFSVQEHPDESILCVDGVPRFSWRFVCWRS
jgi:transcriptional regulator NrdR family protein